MSMKFNIICILIFLTFNPTGERLKLHNFTMVYLTNKIYFMVYAYKLRTRSEIKTGKITTRYVISHV